MFRRQTIAQQHAAIAQQEAAAAAIKTAKFTRLDAVYMLASAVVLAVASVKNLIVTYSIFQNEAHFQMGQLPPPQRNQDSIVFMLAWLPRAVGGIAKGTFPSLGW
jgi:hypothetical protein